MLDRFLNRSKNFKRIFNTDEGKEVLKYLAEEAGQFRTSYVQGDSHGMAFNEGKRYMYNFIVAIIEGNDELVRKAILAEQEKLHLRSTLDGELI